MEANTPIKHTGESQVSRYVVPAILIIMAVLIIVAAATPGDVSNYHMFPAHKNGSNVYEPTNR